MKKSSTLILIFLFVSQLLFAQKKDALIPHYKDMMEDSRINFYTVCDSADAYFAKLEKLNERKARKTRHKEREKERKKNIINVEEENEEESEGVSYEAFKRWKFLNESRYAPSGNRIVDEYLPYKEFSRINRESNNNALAKKSSNWVSLGPDHITKITGHYAAGLGRLEYVEVNKNNNQEIYIGSRSGGLWRTSNGGTTWQQATDFLPGSGVNAIATNPNNFNSVLINVRMANSATSFGIYSSNDGGFTFSPTNFTSNNTGQGGLGSNFKINVIKYHPTIPDLVFVGTSSGIYRSTDNLITWNRILVGADVKDIDFHPSDPNVMYIYESNFTINKNTILKSTDTGVTFTGLSNFVGNNDARLKISVTPTCPDCVFVTSANGIWKSTNNGISFTVIQNPAPTGVSLSNAMPNDQDPTKFVSGYVDLFRSTDSGSTFNQCTWWSLGTNNGTGTNQENYNTSSHYIHADTNYLDCVNGIFYACSDGFLSKSLDNGVTWQKLSLNIGIRENYCLGVSQSNNKIAICGSQDNGNSIKQETEWVEAYGADGMEGIILPLNPSFKIGSYQDGGRIRFNDGIGNSITNITPTGQVGNWVAPLAYNPNNHMTIFSFGSKIHKSTDFGTTWSDLGSPVSFTGTIEKAAISESNSNKIVIAKQNHIELSLDGGLTFSSILNNLPSNLYISDVTFDPDNDNTLIVTYSDVSSAYGQNKVFISTDSGATWSNITYNLGYMPVYKAVIAKAVIYIGAEIGVYYKNLTDTNWTLFNTNLPNVTIRELEVNYGANTLKAATWGRGLWETKLLGKTNYPSIDKTEITNPPTFTSPKTSMPQFVTSEINYTGTLTEVKLAWAIDSPIFNNVNIIPMSLISGNIWKSNAALPDYPSGTKIYFKVIATGSSNDTSETYKFMYELKPFQYCAASGNADGSTYIKRFRCSNIDNTTGDNNYTYYSATPISLIKNNNYNAISNFGYVFSGGSDFYAWIDYNNDAEFTDDEKIATIPNITTGSEVPFSFVVPLTAKEGLTRMRIRAAYYGNTGTSCGTVLGEVEDYLVNILPTVTLNIQENTHREIKMYPNPVKRGEIITITNISGKSTLQLIDLSGKLILNKEINDNQFILPSNIPVGTYIIKIKNNNENYNYKLVVN